MPEADDNKDGKKGGDPQVVDPKQFNELMRSVGALVQAVAGQGKQITALAEALKAPPADDGKGKSSTDDVDLESLSRSDFAKHIVGVMNSQLEPAFQKLVERIDGVNKTQGTKFLTNDMKEFAKSHKDFNDWDSEMAEIAKQTPGITFERAYTLARTENPDKAKELDTKYAPPAPDKPKGFGGLTPTSGISTKNATMKPAEAAQAAWEETMGDIPLGEDAA